MSAADPIAAVIAVLADELGLDPGSMGESSLRNTIVNCAEEAHLSLPEYAIALPVNADLRRQLVEASVVAETHFFRHPQSFSALRSWVQLRRPSGTGRPVRVLSAPCATGEEVYSIAVELSASGLAPLEFTVCGLDVSAPNVAFAQRGIYPGKAFREELARERRAQYFEQVRGHDFWHVAPWLGERVGVRQANLLEEAWSVDAGRYDLIFCRNLLIYLHAAARRKLLGAMHRLLADDGLLFVGSAEMALVGDGGFEREPIAMSFACRKGGRPVLRTPRNDLTESAGLFLVEKPRIEREPALVARAQTSPSTRSAREDFSAPRERVAPAPKPAPAPLDCAHAWALANAGKLTEARREVDLILAQMPALAEAHALSGILFESSGDPAAAEASYRRALFLDPALETALLNLSLLLEGSGRADAARPLRARRARLHPGNAEHNPAE